MILRQKNTAFDPFLLKIVCHHFDSRLLRMILRLFGLWNEVVGVDKGKKLEPETAASFPLAINQLLWPVAVHKINGAQAALRRRR